MTWNSASAWPVLAAAFALSAPAPARAAAAPGCRGLAVETDASVAARWPELAAGVEDAFRARPDVDACARVQLASAGAAIELTVILADGRTAVRPVPRPEDLVPAVEALLVLPERDAAAETAGAHAAAPPAGAGHELAPARAPEATLRAAPPAAERRSPFRIEVGVAADLRAGDGWVVAGGGVESFVHLAHWLLGFQGRIDRYQAGNGRDETVAAELAALAGRRFSAGGNRALDVTLGAVVALRGATSKVTQMTSGGVTMFETRGEQSLARGVLACRLTFGAQSLLRGFVQVDADVGALHAAPDPLYNPAALPAWTLGLGVGAAVGTR